MEASSDLQHQIDHSSVIAASERCYKYKSGDGFTLDLSHGSVSLEGYVSLGDLRSVINGLSQYMMLGRQPRMVHFQVIQSLGTTKAAIRMKGSIRQEVTLPNTRARREVSPLSLVQYPSTSTINGSANVTSLTLLNADDSHDVPIPSTHYLLRLGNLGSYLHSWDLGTLLIAIRAEVHAEIEAHGRNSRLPSTEYSKSLAGLHFWIQRMPWDSVNLAWAELAIIVEGLWLYFVDARHDRETFISVINTVARRQIALGWIGKSLRGH